MTLTDKQAAKLKLYLESLFSLGHRVQETATSLNEPRLREQGVNISATALVLLNDLFDQFI